MTDAPWIDDPLTYLVGNMDRAKFFAEFFEQKSLIVKHNDPARYTDLLSIARIDEIIAGMQLTSKDLDMARAEPQIRRDQFIFENGMIDRGAVVRLYQERATIIMPHLHMLDARLGAFCRAMEAVFSSHVQTNIYLTPPDAQGFRTHYDDHDVFVVQVSGQKRWKLYDMPIANPYRGEGFRPEMLKKTDPVEEFTLRAGECVYIPRGLVHDAATSGDEPSLHITIGLIVKTWADLMLEAVSEVALRHPGFRKSLPPGFARDDFDRTEAENIFRDLANTFAKEADFEESFELFVETFIRGRSADTSGGVLGVTDQVNSGDRFKLRKNTPARLRFDEKEALILAPGGEVRFNRAAVPAVELALSGAPFGLDAFNALEEDKAKDLIRMLIAYGLVERV